MNYERVIADLLGIIGRCGLNVPIRPQILTKKKER